MGREKRPWYPPDGLAIVRGIGGQSRLQYGLIAEEVAEIYPELVVRDTTASPRACATTSCPAMLLNELQRQQRQLEAQERLIDDLTARLSRLEAKAAAAAR